MGNAVVHRAACIVVVARGIGKGPAVSVVCACIRVRGSTQVETDQAFASNASRRTCRCVRVAIVSHTIGRDADRRVCPSDLKVLRVAAAIMVRIPGIGVARRGRACVRVVGIVRRLSQAQVCACHRHRARRQRCTVIGLSRRTGHHRRG